MQNFKNSSVQKEIIKSFFNRTSERWNNLYSGKSFINMHMSERKKIVLDSVDEFSNGSKLKILDLGCGSGILTKELVNKGHILVGADIAEEMITKLRGLFKDEASKNFMGATICDAGKMSFCESTFDVVLCVGLLQYQLEDNLILREIAKVLKKEGICIVTFPNLLRINYFFDPFYYIKFIYRFLKKKFFNMKLRKSNGNYKPGRLTGTFQKYYPYDKKYYFGNIKKLFAENKLYMEKVVSFGYGPFTVFKKQILPDSISFSISMLINNLALKSKLGLFDYIANRWVCVVKRRDDVFKN